MRKTSISVVMWKYQAANQFLLNYVLSETTPVGTRRSRTSLKICLEFLFLSFCSLSVPHPAFPLNTPGTSQAQSGCWFLACMPQFFSGLSSAQTSLLCSCIVSYQQDCELKSFGMTAHSGRHVTLGRVLVNSHPLSSLGDRGPSGKNPR